MFVESCLLCIAGPIDWHRTHLDIADPVSLNLGNSRKMCLVSLGKEKTVAALRQADAVVFDVDSTVQTHEGIDRLAEHCGKLEDVRRLTQAAMQGSVMFQDALRQRLQIINPTISQFKEVASAPVSLVPGVHDLVKRLRQLGKDVFLVSGGFRDMIKPVADALEIDDDHVFANKLLFEENGTFATFDESQPTAYSGGKQKCIEIIKKRYNYENVIIVGDGFTDLEARPSASAFIGFGGVQRREIIATASDWYVEDFAVVVSALSD